MAAESTLIYPKGRPAAAPAALRQSAASHRPEGLPNSLVSTQLQVMRWRSMLARSQ